MKETFPNLHQKQRQRRMKKTFPTLQQKQRRRRMKKTSLTHQQKQRQENEGDIPNPSAKTKTGEDEEDISSPSINIKAEEDEDIPNPSTKTKTEEELGCLRRRFDQLTETEDYKDQNLRRHLYSFNKDSGCQRTQRITSRRREKTAEEGPFYPWWGLAQTVHGDRGS